MNTASRPCLRGARIIPQKILVCLPVSIKETMPAIADFASPTANPDLPEYKSCNIPGDFGFEPLTAQLHLE
jgi:hypothetical protein